MSLPTGTSSPHQPRIGLAKGLQMGLTAAVLSSLGNTVLLFVGRTVGLSLLMPSPTGEMAPLHWIFPVIASSLPSLLAPGVLALLLRSVKHEPQRAFRNLSLLLLLLSFATPFALPASVALATKLFLNLMHIVPAAVILRVVRQ